MSAGVVMDRQQLEHLLIQDSQVHSISDVLLRLRGKASWRVEPMDEIQRRAPNGLEILTTYADGVAYWFSRVGREFGVRDIQIGNPMFREYVLQRNDESQAYVVADFRNDYGESPPPGV